MKLAALGAVLLGAAAALIWLDGWGPDPAPPSPQAHPAPAPAPQPATLAVAPAAIASPVITLTGDALPPLDTESDGAWRLDAQGRLRVEQAVRRRFDFHLAQRGTPELWRERVRREALAELGEPALPEVLALFDRYLTLQQHRWQLRLDLQRPETWRAVLAERQTQRRLQLGSAWAEAFYATEEADLVALIERMEGRDPSPARTAGTEPAPHPHAAERMAALQAEWAQWERRLAAARPQWQALARAPELSEPQRAAAQRALLEQHFKEDERARALALLTSDAATP